MDRAAGASEPRPLGRASSGAVRFLSNTMPASPCCGGSFLPEAPKKNESPSVCRGSVSLPYIKMIAPPTATASPFRQAKGSSRPLQGLRPRRLGMPHFMLHGMTRCARKGDDHLAGDAMDMRGGAVFHMRTAASFSTSNAGRVFMGGLLCPAAPRMLISLASATG